MHCLKKKTPLPTHHNLISFQSLIFGMIIDDSHSKPSLINLYDHFLGFCDSVLSETQVFNAIKERVEVNVAEIDKVIIICSDRIEGVQVAAIKKCMKWLQFNDHKEKFSFIYNKSDRLTKMEKIKNLAYMCDSLDADLTTRFEDRRSGSPKQTKLNHALGFPREATYASVKEDLATLMAITLANPKPERITLHTKSIRESCTIL